jgi:hypothetical protein
VVAQLLAEGSEDGARVPAGWRPAPTQPLPFWYAQCHCQRPRPSQQPGWLRLQGAPRAGQNCQASQPPPRAQHDAAHAAAEPLVDQWANQSLMHGVALTSMS